jgi:hypothetical protein
MTSCEVWMNFKGIGVSEYISVVNIWQAAGGSDGVDGRIWVVGDGMMEGAEWTERNRG